MPNRPSGIRSSIVPRTCGSSNCVRRKAVAMVPGADHPPDHLLSEEKCALEVGIENLVPLSLGHLESGFAEGGSGVVDQHVQAPEPLECRPDRSRNRSEIGEVE